MVRAWTMDNGKGIEMTAFHTNRHLAKIQRYRRGNKLISRRMLGEFEVILLRPL